MSEISPDPKIQAQIIELLKASPKPLTAYEIIGYLQGMSPISSTEGMVNLVDLVEKGIVGRLKAKSLRDSNQYYLIEQAETT